MKITRRKRPFIEMLLTRWDMLAAFGATEKIYNSTENEPEIRALLDQMFAHAIRPGSMEEMRLIKNKIVEILPEAGFVVPDYEAPQELDSEDYVQLYMAHQRISIDKVGQLMREMKIK